MPKKVTIYYIVKAVMSVTMMILYMVYALDFPYHIKATIVTFAIGICVSTVFIILDSIVLAKYNNHKVKKLIFPLVASIICVFTEITGLTFYFDMVADYYNSLIILIITTWLMFGMLMLIMTIRVAEFTTNIIAAIFVATEKEQTDTNNELANGMKANMDQYTGHIKDLFNQEMIKINNLKSDGLLNNDEYDELRKSIEVKYNMQRND